MTNSPKITVSTTIIAPIQLIWDCFNGPEHNVIWNTGHPDWHTPKSIIDLRVGGQFIHTMAARDGSMSFDFKGTFLEIKPLEYIHYEMEDSRDAEIFFEKSGGSIKLTEVFETETQNSLELQHAGWQEIIDNFKKYVEGL